MQDVMDRIQDYLLGGPPGGLNNQDPVASYYNKRILVGANNLETDMGPPRIVIVPKGGVDNQTPQYPGRNSNPSTLRTKDITFTVHIWGSTRNDCEYMQAGVLTACFLAVTGPTTYIDNDYWVPTGHDSAGFYLVSEFRMSGFTVPRISLPLQKPITTDYDKEVTLRSLMSVTTPALDDSTTTIVVDTS
jgi:hypothetical protein